MSKRKRAFSRDAAVIWNLHKEQPLNLLSLTEKTMKSIGKSEEYLDVIQKSLKYDILPFLVTLKVVRRLKDDMFALGDFTELEEKLVEIFKECQKTYEQLSLNEIANRLGLPSAKMEESAYKLAPKFNLKIGTENKEKMKFA